MENKDIEGVVEELSRKFTLVGADGTKRKLPQHDWIMEEIEEALKAEGDRRVEEERERLRVRVEFYASKSGMVSKEIQKPYKDTLNLIFKALTPKE
jgi:hypothetical protein